MNLFDFFFPDVAQADYLRELADNSKQQTILAHRERINFERERRSEESKVANLETRIQQLEKDVGQASLVIESLLELLEEAQVITRDAVAHRTAEIDGRDGCLDGRHTPPAKVPFTPKRKWNGPRE